MSEIMIPKINSRQKGLQIQFYTTIPTKYSETGKRHQITGASEDEVKKKFRKEARRTITGQVDLEKHKNDTKGRCGQDHNLCQLRDRTGAGRKESASH